jgi:hypothetical protein
MRCSPDGDDTWNFYVGITMNQEMTPMYPHLVLLIHHSIHEERIREAGQARLAATASRGRAARNQFRLIASVSKWSQAILRPAGARLPSRVAHAAVKAV